MSSLSLKDLALSKMLPSGYSAVLPLSMESAEALSEAVQTGNIESLTDIAEQVNEQVVLVDDAVRVSGGLSDLVDETMQVYGDGGITEQGAELLRISVESFLRVSGIDIPASMIVPSFESNKTQLQYSTEVIDRKDNLLTKILSWLYTALKAIADSLKQFWTKLTVNSHSLKTYINHVKQRVAAVEGEVKDPDAKINLGASSIWLTNQAEQLTKPSIQIVNTVARFEDFVTEWRDKWTAITSIDIPARNTTTQDIVKTSDRIRELALVAVKTQARSNINFVVTHSLELHRGPGEVPLLGATCKIEQVVSGKNHMADVLTIAEMREGVDDALASLKVLEKLQGEIVKADRATTRIGNLSKNTSVRDGENIDVEEMRTALRTLSKACSLSSWGWTNTTPYFLKTIKACVAYIDACTHRYGVKG